MLIFLDVDGKIIVNQNSKYKRKKKLKVINNIPMSFSYIEKSKP